LEKEGTKNFIIIVLLTNVILETYPSLCYTIFFYNIDKTVVTPKIFLKIALSYILLILTSSMSEGPALRIWRGIKQYRARHA